MRNEIQAKAVQLYQKHKNIVLEWFTGTGKSLAAIKCIASTNEDYTIVCAEINHIQNWKDDIIKHGFQHILDRLDFICYASIHKLKGKSLNLVLDECHHLRSKKRVDAARSIKGRKIFLSATIESDIKKKVIDTLDNDIYYYTVDMQSAIDMGIVNRPIIYKVDCYLDNRERNLIYKKSSGSKKNRKTFTCDAGNVASKVTALRKKGIKSYELEIKCNEQEYYNLITQDIVYYMQNSVRMPFYKKLAIYKGSQRKRFLADCKSRRLKQLLNEIEDIYERLVVFTGSISQSNEVGHKFTLVNSKNKNSADNIKRFNNLKVNKLFAVQMLREGMNLRNIDAGVIAQLDSKELSFIQMLGRCFRSENPVMFVLVMRHTNDERFFETATSQAVNYIKNWNNVKL